MDTGRLDQTIRDLERLQRDADGIIDSYVDYKIADAPTCLVRPIQIVPRLSARRLDVDRIAALKHVKSELTK